MSLKYRLIILSVAVFAATFACGAVLGLSAARRLAEGQLRAHLDGVAAAAIRSGMPLESDVLTQYAPLVDAQIMVLGGGNDLRAHSKAPWDWAAVQRLYAGADGGRIELADRRLFFGRSAGTSARTREPVTVVALADERAAVEPTQRILYSFMGVMAAMALLLAGGTYLIGWRIVRRITRLSNQIDQTLAEGATSARRGGDELQRLEQAFADLRERLARSRERLAAQQRLATTGKLASMVAHEVRNPLQALRLTVEMLCGKLPADQREACDILIGEIDRLNRLTDELLILAGKDARRVEAVDLGKELVDVLRLLRLQLRQRELVSDAALPPLPAVEMDRNRCRQLLLNILLNAVEASPRGGVIAVSARVEAHQVRLSVADQGQGFPDAVLTGQAEELFSTKSTGAGLGLSICRRIVEEAQGTLTLYNAASGGAVAEISLPARPASGQAGASERT